MRRRWELNDAIDWLNVGFVAALAWFVAGFAYFLVVVLGSPHPRPRTTSAPDVSVVVNSDGHIWSGAATVAICMWLGPFGLAFLLAMASQAAKAVRRSGWPLRRVWEPLPDLRQEHKR